MRHPHPSQPWNPLIANVLYRAGVIEQWGTGTTRIADICTHNGNPPPKWEERCGTLIITFRPAKAITRPATEQTTGEVAPEVAPEVLKMLAVISGEMNRADIMKALELKDEKHFREHYQQVAISQGLIEMTTPDKPRSSKQKYRVTERGRVLLNR